VYRTTPSCVARVKLATKPSPPGARSTQESSEGSLKKGAQKTFVVKVKLSGCSYLGFAEVTWTTAEFEFGAEGWVSLLNKPTMTVSGAGCSITLEPFKDLSTVSYKNVAGGKLEASSALKSIAFKSTGGICGPSGDLKYQGGSASELVGGTLEWK
jgi:hypothetical protein